MTFSHEALVDKGIFGQILQKTDHLSLAWNQCQIRRPERCSKDVFLMKHCHPERH